MSTPWALAILILWAVVILQAVVLIGLLRRGTGALEAVEQWVSASRLGLAPGGATAGMRVPPFEVLTPELSSSVLASSFAACRSCS